MTPAHTTAASVISQADDGFSAAAMRSSTANCNSQNSVQIRRSATSARPLWPHDTRVTMANMSEPRQPMLRAWIGAKPSTAVPVPQFHKCETPESTKARPSHKNPRCNIASRRIFKLCARPQTAASHSTTPPAASSTRPRTSSQPRALDSVTTHGIHTDSTSMATANSSTHSTQNGRQACNMGTASEVKKGIMRCATAM
ncbi:hypothetical protein FQZ97_900830 [compost metagenome]